MSVEPEVILLIERNRLELVEAQIEPCTLEHLENYVDRWLAELDLDDNDYLWDWEAKKRIYVQTDIAPHECWVLTAYGDVQGLILLTDANQYRAQHNERQKVVYVRYISSAPWNRTPPKSLMERPAFKRVGAALLAFAGKRSRALNCGGYVSLHALPGTESYYETLGLRNCGPDSEQDGLVYFEVRYQR